MTYKTIEEMYAASLAEASTGQQPEAQAEQLAAAEAECDRLRGLLTPPAEQPGPCETCGGNGEVYEYYGPDDPHRAPCPDCQPSTHKAFWEAQSEESCINAWAYRSTVNIVKECTPGPCADTPAREGNIARSVPLENEDGK